MQRGRYPSDLTEKQSQRIEPLLPAAKTGGRPAKHDRVAILNAILYWVRTGCAWRRLPHDLPHGKTVYHDFRCWRLDGTWKRIHDGLSKDNEYLPATSETIIYITMIGLMIRRLVQE